MQDMCHYSAEESRLMKPRYNRFLGTEIGIEYRAPCLHDRAAYVLFVDA